MGRNRWWNLVRMGVPRGGGGTDPDAYANKVLATQTADLVGYWRLNEAGGVDVADSSGHVLTGEAADITWDVTGIGDGSTAANFDGNNDSITLPHAALDAAIDLSKGSLLAWINTEWVDTDIRTVFRMEFGGGSQLSLNLSATGVMVFRHDNGSSRAQLVYSPSGAGWRPVIVTWDSVSGEALLYLDGSEVNSNLGVGAWTDTATQAHIGSNSGSTHFWRGDMAHVALWDTPLSPAQIANLATV